MVRDPRISIKHRRWNVFCAHTHGKVNNRIGVSEAAQAQARPGLLSQRIEPNKLEFIAMQYTRLLWSFLSFYSNPAERLRQHRTGPDTGGGNVPFSVHGRLWKPLLGCKYAPFNTLTYFLFDAQWKCVCA